MENSGNVRKLVTREACEWGRLTLCQGLFGVAMLRYFKEKNCGKNSKKLKLLTKILQSHSDFT
ncbi:unnamed protein product [Moneuplotes crassus]|uniref:Uncharacterized protein n=1 Tax=Euplotes crassus TaxID=5936 RepID=A0AAD1Y846_EUPCR|nr:unnamed protein product [Moneuplotes crassus]